MKVICIDDLKWGIGVFINDGFVIKFGNIYTVVHSGYADGVLAYILLEDPSRHDGYGWEAKRFAPISNIDETEFERSFIKEKV